MSYLNPSARMVYLDDTGKVITTVNADDCTELDRGSVLATADAHLGQQEWVVCNLYSNTQRYMLLDTFSNV